MSRDKGIIHIIPLIILGIVALVAVVLLLIYYGAIQNPAPEIIKITPQVDVEPAPDYKNPLDEETQYTNPFSEYKNPFDTLK